MSLILFLRRFSIVSKFFFKSSNFPDLNLSTFLDGELQILSFEFNEILLTWLIEQESSL